jgi:Biotin carboxylase C-terminal domain
VTNKLEQKNVTAFEFICPVAQFGHLFAKGDTREAAIRAMVVALKEVKIRGEIRTIVDYAVEMIQSPDFVNNSIHTGWLDNRIALHVGPSYFAKPMWCNAAYVAFKSCFVFCSVSSHVHVLAAFCTSANYVKMCEKLVEACDCLGGADNHLQDCDNLGGACYSLVELLRLWQSCGRS